MQQPPCGKCPLLPAFIQVFNFTVGEVIQNSEHAEYNQPKQLNTPFILGTASFQTHCYPRGNSYRIEACV